MAKIRVQIMDDHSVVRAGIKLALHKSKKIVICAEAGNEKECLEKIRQTKPDVVIHDLSIPGVNGMELLQTIKKQFPLVKILIFTMHDEAEYVVPAIELGINGYLLKNTDLTEIEKAVLTIHAGNNFYSQHLTGIMANSIKSRKIIDVNPKNDLTDREKQVLACIVKGLSNKMTADTLKISIKTVSVHRTNIMKKINAANTADLVRIALENKLS
jgi:DNA-binding NarL/FixJ family response regulator